MQREAHVWKTAEIGPTGNPARHLSLTGIAVLVHWGVVKSGRFCHILSFALLLLQPAHGTEISLDADQLERRGSIVKLPSKEGQAPEGMLRNESGTWLPYQTTPDGDLTFIVPIMKAGEKMILTFGDRAPRTVASVKAEQIGDQLKLSSAGREVASYQATAKKNPRPNLNPLFLRGGYLHPLVTPAGKIVTDDYPLNHLHHHGIWMAWTKTSYDGREPDFWNMGQGKGKVDFVSLDKTWSGPVEAGMVAQQKYTDLTSSAPIDVLEEIWTVRTYQTGAAFHILDLNCAQTIVGKIPLLLPVYHYGGLGIRGLEAWNGKRTANFVTSENETDRNKANGKTARWIAMTGQADGAIAGIAILSHPENFRAPQPVRIHPNEPFISFAPQITDAMSIQPGETYRARYRFIIFDGAADPQLIDSLWQDYATPIKAAWKD